MNWFNIIFVITSVALMVVILLQNRSAGLGTAFGAGSEGFHVRRGGEKKLFQATVALSVLFLSLSFLHLFL